MTTEHWALSTEHWAMSSLQLSQHLFMTNRRQNWNFHHTLLMGMGALIQCGSNWNSDIGKCSNWFIPDFSGMNQSWCSPWSWRRRTRDRPTWPGGDPEWQETVLDGFPALLSDELLDSNNWLAKCSLPCSWQWNWRKGSDLMWFFCQRIQNAVFWNYWKIL